MRSLFLTAETCPTYRADMSVLLAKYLRRLDIRFDIVSGKAPGVEGSVHWGDGETCRCDVSGRQAKTHIKILWHGVQHLFGAKRSRYQAIQARDMSVLTVFVLLTDRLKGLSFFYWMPFPIGGGQSYITGSRSHAQIAELIALIYKALAGDNEHEA